MSEEIKEILDRLDFNEWEVDLYEVPITWSELYDVRDYITNLQKEIDRLNNIINEFEKYIKTEAKIELYKDKTGFRTFADSDDILNKLNELKEKK